MNQTEKAIRDNFPGPDNEALRDRIRRAAASTRGGSAVRHLAGLAAAMSPEHRAKLDEVAATVPNHPDDVDWYVPPECRASALEVSYGRDSIGYWERRRGISAATVEYRLLAPAERVVGIWEPWLAVPPIAKADR